MPGSEMEGWDVWQACFVQSMATMDLPAMVTACGTSSAPSSKRFERLAEREARQLAAPSGSAEVPRLDHIVELQLSCSFHIRGGLLVSVPGEPSTVPGIR